MNSPEPPLQSTASGTNSGPANTNPPGNSKSGRGGFFEDMVVTLFGMASSGAVAYGSFYASHELNFAPYTWMVNFIIPAGAILCGFVAAVGYWAGSRLFHHRPTRLLLLNIVIVSLGTFFSIHHLDYSHESAGDRPLESVMSFPEYMVAVTEHMTYSSSDDRDNPTELGKWGWGVAALQVGGFCLGGFGVYALLVAVPYCNRCSKYFNLLWRRSIRWKDLAAMGQTYDAEAQLLQSGELQSAVDQFAGLPNQSKFRTKGLLSMELRKCPTCENRQIKLLAHKRVGNRFQKIGELKVPTELPISRPAVTAAK